MADIRVFTPGGYRFIKGPFMYSAGIAAEPGFRVERVRFAEILPVVEGFRRAAALIEAAGRPLTAFAACELRSPEPFTEGGFRGFNEVYVETLKAWGIIGPDGTNPVARSNVCPEVSPPPESGFHAFSYTVPDEGARPSFVVAGSAEAKEGDGPYRDKTVAFGDVSPAGMAAKARHVLDEMERRMGALGFGWRDATAVQVYSVRDIHPLMAEEIGSRGALASGITWHFCRPPVVDLEYEMDCRGVHLEQVSS